MRTKHKKYVEAEKKFKLWSLIDFKIFGFIHGKNVSQ